MALDNQTFGVIVGVEKEAARVLTNQGRPEKPDVRVCRLPDIQKKLLVRRNVTQDSGELGCAPAPYTIPPPWGVLPAGSAARVLVGVAMLLLPLLLHAALKGRGGQAAGCMGAG